MPTTEKDGDKLANNDGKIVLGLDIPKTASQINADIQKLEKQLKQVKACLLYTSDAADEL